MCTYCWATRVLLHCALTPSILTSNLTPARLTENDMKTDTVAAAHGRARPEASDKDRPDQPIRVLCISDVILLRAGVRYQLESSGLAVEGEADSCKEAIPLAQRVQPNIIVVDLELPTDDFACFPDVVLAAGDTRIVALGEKRRASAAWAIELGAAGLVRKDEPADVLCKAIRKVHAGELWLDRTTTASVLRRMTHRRRSEDFEAAKIATLTKRENEIVSLIGEGLQNRDISQRLFISPATVRNHLTSIFDKLDVADRFELAVYAFRQGLVHWHHETRGAEPVHEAHRTDGRSERLARHDGTSRKR
jgi:two-component system nitrate/nitrite response regulator NarL